MYHDNISTGFRAWPLGLCCQVIKGVQCIKNKNIKKADDRDRQTQTQRERQTQREKQRQGQRVPVKTSTELCRKPYKHLVLAYVFQSILISAAIAS